MLFGCPIYGIAEKCDRTGKQGDRQNDSRTALLEMRNELLRHPHRPDHIRIEQIPYIRFENPFQWSHDSPYPALLNTDVIVSALSNRFP